MRGIHIFGMSIMTKKQFELERKEAYEDGETSLAILSKTNPSEFLLRVITLTEGLTAQQAQSIRAKWTPNKLNEKFSEQAKRFAGYYAASDPIKEKFGKEIDE